VLLVGAAATALLLRRIGAAVDAIADAQRRTRRLEDTLVPVHVETRRARRSLDRLDRR
jgi:hypothetical protein